MGEDNGERPASLLPYDEWTDEALRHVAVRALEHAAREGLPGAHHFYLTFRTDYEGVVIPPRMRALYPQEMTITLQHQFWDLKVGDTSFSVGLSFKGIPSTVTVPFGALIAFADPQVSFGLHFRVIEAKSDTIPILRPRGGPVAVRPVAELAAPATTGDAEADTAADAGEEPPVDAAEPPNEQPQVVSLDAFRRRPTPKE